MKNQVFLGGTIGDNNWRKEKAIPYLLKQGVVVNQIYDPVVDEWDKDSEKLEDLAKHESAYRLFYIAHPKTPGNAISTYSLVEAIVGLYDYPESTVVVFDTVGMPDQVRKAIIKTEKEMKLRFPTGYIFQDLDAALTFLAESLKVA